MSLHVLADHMASKGRGPDSMLIHMAPSEVRGLQALAVQHGGSLTINPETGLPEAGFLDKLLPAIIGFAITATTGIPAWQVGLGVGAVETVRTGDLGRGISAGLGAYGGADFGAGLSEAGASTIGATEAAKGLTMTPELAAELQIAGEGAKDTLLQQQVADKMAAATPYEKLSSGVDAFKNNPMGMTKSLAMPAMMAAAPIFADQAVKANMPSTTSAPGEMHTYSYNPYGQLYTPTGNYQVPKKAAGGGLMGMDNGGYGPGELNFAQQYDPVIRMAPGGVAGFYGAYGDPNYVGELTGDYKDAEVAAYIRDNKLSGGALDNKVAAFNITPDQLTRAQGLLAPSAPNASSVSDASNAYKQAIQANPNAVAGNAQTEANMQAVLDAYGGVGRKGIGSTANTIDQQGYDFWLNALNNGTLTKDDLNKQFGSAVNKYVTQTPDDKYADYVQKYVVDKYALPTGTAEEFLTGTRNVGLYDQALADALEETKFSLGARQGLTSADIGNPLNVAENYGGLKGVSSNINYYVDTYVADPTNTNKTGAQKRAEFQKELDRYRLNEDDVIRATGKTIAELFRDAEIKKTVSTFDTTNPYGNNTGNALTSTPGDLTKNADGTITVQPNIPGRPEGGFPGMGAVKDAYTAGGGSLGYIPYAPKTMEEFNAKYNKLTGGSKEAYDRLTGKTKYSPIPYTETGEIMKPYAESVMGTTIDKSSKRVLFDPATRTYKPNPDYIPVSYTATGKKVYGLSGNDISTQLPGMDADTANYGQWMTDNNVTYAQIAEALGISLAEAKKRYPKKEVVESAEGGLAALTMARGGVTRQPFFSKATGKFNTASPKVYADGGMAEQFNLGGYSDGGRLLRGPGDGVSDSIPATIGNKRPARLADGEFVVPARIVSELGNGSTEAGARKLYAMMDRVQSARRGSIGKGKVANNSRADKYLPA